MLSQNLTSILFSKHSFTVYNLLILSISKKIKPVLNQQSFNIYVTQYYSDQPNTNCSSEINQTAVLPSDTILHGKVKAPSLINRLYPSFNMIHLELENIVTKQFDQSLRTSLHTEVTLTAWYVWKELKKVSCSFLPEGKNAGRMRLGWFSKRKGGVSLDRIGQCLQKC